MSFVDAGWNPSSRVCGMGWAIRDPRGTVVSQVSNTRSLKICSDSQVLINLLNSKDSGKELKGILSDISCLKDSFFSISFAFLSRVKNSEADAVAKPALSLFSLSSLGGVARCNV
ncbi:unnamed protein product [Arabidopsis arenosa]|uniref:RNase H type-1 domain-containing protein n=1 Tax=Arabidopsis arenosa TaxID=38785 RepID=A0A8S1ZUC2_ARAAE|nr:unnamed protein product [Arabidopsis arenosa]